MENMPPHPPHIPHAGHFQTLKVNLFASFQQWEKKTSCFENMSPRIKIHLQWGKKRQLRPTQKKYFSSAFLKFGASHCGFASFYKWLSKVILNTIGIFKFESYPIYPRKLTKYSIESCFIQQISNSPSPFLFMLGGVSIKG